MTSQNVLRSGPRQGGAASRRENLSLNDDLRCRPADAGTSQALAHLDGNSTVGLCMLPIRIGCDDRQPGVRLFTDIDVQRHLTEERHAEALRFMTGAAMAENV